MQIRTITRRRLAAVLAALTAAVAVPAALQAVNRVPAPQIIYYYADGSYTTQVGEGEWGCDAKYHQIWGTTSLYRQFIPIDCDIQQ